MVVAHRNSMIVSILIYNYWSTCEKQPLGIINSSL
jgi:hypothetical protein